MAKYKSVEIFTNKKECVMFRYNVVNFLCLLLGTIFCPFILFANSNFGNDPSNAVSEYTMIEVFDSHGIETARHKDNLGDPHLTFLTKTNAFWHC